MSDISDLGFAVMVMLTCWVCAQIPQLGHLSGNYICQVHPEEAFTFGQTGKLQWLEERALLYE